MDARVINFGPGPSTLPLAALRTAHAELLNYQGTGMSIMEHSHRGPAYDAVHQEAKALLRSVLSIPESHEILFMQGGARGQFALIPMNLLPRGQRADYLTTGTWAEQALEEAQLLGSAREVINTKNRDGIYDRVPDPGELALDPHAAYVHLTSNNTIFGTQYHAFPDAGAVPLIADMSSDICARPLDVSPFGLIYAGAQKNLGVAGVTVVIIRKDLIEKASTTIPSIFRYRAMAASDSMQNTPPTFAIYMMRNVLRWIDDEGGLSAMESRNNEKAEALYSSIDARPDFYRSPVQRASRSLMNIVFRLPSEALEQRFVQAAEQERMVGLRGHRLSGGIRASVYNAIGPADVRQLVQFMDRFASAHG